MIKKKGGCEMRLEKVKRPSGAGVVGIFDPLGLGCGI